MTQIAKGEPLLGGQTKVYSGTGRSFASFGEIVQGRLPNGEDFLVTLPVDLWSYCELVGTSVTGCSSVNTPFSKARTIAEQLLKVCAREEGVRIDLSFRRDMPVGKGLSSSTADMLAVVRAFQQAFSFEVSQGLISHLFTPIEPHDALHYPTSVTYNHRSGQLLQELDYTPDFCIVGVDAGGELSTLVYNSCLSFTTEQLNAYEQLYHDLHEAFTLRDDVAIARCASRSAALHVERSGHVLLAELLTLSQGLGALGVLATHSGTCAALLLAGDTAEHEVYLMKEQLAVLGRVFTTHTLTL